MCREVSRSIREVLLRFPCFVMWRVEPCCITPTTTVFYGSTDAGKSRNARVICGADPPENVKWFGGFEGQEKVISEELYFRHVLRLSDRYDCKVQYKGGIVSICSYRDELARWFIHQSGIQTLSRSEGIFLTADVHRSHFNLGSRHPAGHSLCLRPRPRPSVSFRWQISYSCVWAVSFLTTAFLFFCVPLAILTEY